MQGDNIKSRWQQTRGKKRAHWGILTLDDLPKTNWRYNQLIAQLQARNQAVKGLDDEKLKKKSEDYSI